MPDTTLAARLRTLREARGLRAADLARLAVNGHAVPGAALDSMARQRGQSREELEKDLGLRKWRSGE